MPFHPWPPLPPAPPAPPAPPLPPLAVKAIVAPGGRLQVVVVVNVALTQSGAGDADAGGTTSAAATTAAAAVTPKRVREIPMEYGPFIG